MKNPENRKFSENRKNPENRKTAKTIKRMASQSEQNTHSVNFLKVLIASRNTKGSNPFANPRQLNVKVKKINRCARNQNKSPGQGLQINKL